MAKIIFENKVATRTSTLPAINQIRDIDINEIKESVNALYHEKVIVEISDAEMLLLATPLQYLPDLPVGFYYETKLATIKFVVGTTNTGCDTDTLLVIKQGDSFVDSIEAQQFVADAPRSKMYLSNLQMRFQTSYALTNSVIINDINKGYSVATISYTDFLPTSFLSANGGQKIIIEHEYLIREF